MLGGNRNQRLRLPLGLAPVAEELMKGPIAEDGLSDRVGMGQLVGRGECLVAPRPGLFRVAKPEKRMGKPVQADYARVMA